jgi:hypothetical protein
MNSVTDRAVFSVTVIRVIVDLNAVIRNIAVDCNNWR